MLSAMTKYPYIPDLVTLNHTFFNDFRLSHLVDLQLDHTEINFIDERNFSGIPNLRVLNISHNYISIYDLRIFFREILQHLSKLETLDISHQTDTMKFFAVNVVFYLPPNLFSLDMSYIKRADDIEPFILGLNNPSKLSYFKFQGNMVNNLSEFEFYSPDTTARFVADFAHNNMISFTGSFNKSILFNGLCVSGLILYDNRLGDELSHNGEYVFKYLKDLLTLDLSSNGIKHLPHSTFKNQNNLRLNQKNLSV